MTSTDRIYLDNNATTQPSVEVVEAMSRASRDCYGNPGSKHAEGRRARQALEDSREKIAEIVGADPKEVVFTSGGTEASNLALFGLTPSLSGLSNSSKDDPKNTILLTAGEHPATLETCKALQQRGAKLQYLDVDSEGRLIEEQYGSVEWDNILLATFILAHNETGVIQDFGPLAGICREHRVPFHVDGVQAVGKLPVNFRELGVSTLSIGAHKFHGPRGIGALLVRDDVRLTPVLFGGHQEAERRPGTELVALAVGMATALESWHRDKTARTEKLNQLRNQLQTGLLTTCSPTVVNGSQEHRLPNTLNIAFPGLNGEAILAALDLEGISCSLGSACASGSTEPAPSLVAMGSPPEVYNASVRLSVGVFNTIEEIDDAVGRIAKVIARLRTL